MDLVIIDSGGANIGSVTLAFQRLGIDPVLTKDPALIRQAGRVVLPGVGSFRSCMSTLNDAGLAPVVRELNQPVLGICVGLQMLAQGSEEDVGDQPTPGLGVFEGSVRKLTAPRLPHMGWARTESHGHALFEGLGDAYFYYVHSYAVPSGSEDCIASCIHGSPFSAALARGNFGAVQFHPERSAAAGARLLKNFIAWQP